MKKAIIYPCNPLNDRQVDPAFACELTMAKLLGYDYYLLDFDLLASEKKVAILGMRENPYATIDGDFEWTTAFYRGWMMSDEKYGMLEKFLYGNHVHMMTHVQHYRRCHYFPQVYDAIKDYTPRTVWTDDPEKLREKADELGTDMLMKDYVKSTKEQGIVRIPKDISEGDLKAMAAKFTQDRGKLFEGGIVLKEFVELNGNEWRVFVRKRAVGHSFIKSNNTNTPTTVEPPDALIEEVIGHICADHRFDVALRNAEPLHQPIPTFFTVDFAQQKDGKWIVIEVGDGGVSGLSPNQNPLGLYNILF